MEWLWVVLAAGVALYLWRRPKAAKPQPPAASRLGMNMASDRELMLATFRRELANYMVRLDPDRFLSFYRKARAAEVAIDAADKDEREAHLTIIAKRYPFYTDFDIVGTRDHVLYADALSGHSLEDIEDHYLNLVWRSSRCRCGKVDGI